MDGAGAHPDGGIAPARQGRGWLSWLLPPATALVVVVASVLLLTTPLWMHFALDADGGALPGTSSEVSHAVSDRTVEELLSGSGTFEDISRCIGDPAPPCLTSVRIYTADEAAHLRDARLLLWVFVALAVASAVFIGAALIHRPKDARRWRAVARGGAGLAVGAVVIGVVGFFAFDALFTLFHEVFFPQGNWEFPADSNMIRLYPFAFWQRTAAALVVLCVIAGGALWWFARWRARRLAQ